MTLFEALMGGAFDHLNWQHSGNLTKIFQKSQVPGGLPGGSIGGFGIVDYHFFKFEHFSTKSNKNIRLFHHCQGQLFTRFLDNRQTQQSGV